MNTILFDLDGTLLPMNQSIFINDYLRLLAEKFAPLGFNGNELINAVWHGTECMYRSDSRLTNLERFWRGITEILGNDILNYKGHFDNFYHVEFQDAIHSTKPNPLSRLVVNLLKEKGYCLALATNPLFPAIATQSRIRWAGLDPSDFLHVSTYEDYHFCKPSLHYYSEFLNGLGKTPEECLMVGNDAAEDMAAADLGLDTYLITDCLINSGNCNIDVYKNGSFQDFFAYANSLPTLI